MLDDPQHRVAGEAALVLADAEQRLVGAVRGLRDRQRAQRDRRQQRVDREDGDHDAVDRARDRRRLVSGLLGHVRDRLDAGVGDHRDGDRDDEVLPGRRDPEVDVVHEDLRREDEHEPEHHEQELRREVGDGEQDVEPRRLLDAEDVDHRQQRDDDDPADHVARPVAQRLPEQRAEVVRHEEGRDRDRDDVVEHLAPSGEEGPELVEGVAREAGRAARLRVHRRRLRVGGGGQVEDESGDDEDDRRQAEREARHQPEGVVDRAADVAVGGREEGVDPEHALEAVEATLGHLGVLLRMLERDAAAPRLRGRGALAAGSRSSVDRRRGAA